MTDSRYFLQAEQELKGNKAPVSYKLVVQTQAEYVDWLCEDRQMAQVVGCDFWCYSMWYRSDTLKDPRSCRVKTCQLWRLTGRHLRVRAPLPITPVYEHEVKYAGKTRAEKLMRSESP
ncbi:MAG: hypothetical protein U0T81_04770 [Saprospiraceae bacterium]